MRSGALAASGLLVVLFGALTGCVHEALLVPPKAPQSATLPQELAQADALPPVQSLTAPTLPTSAPAVESASIAPSGPTQPLATVPPAGSVDPLPHLRELHQKAEASYRTVDSYIARLRRREFVGGKAGPEELLLFKFRKQPMSVHLKWLGTEGKGREVLYVQGRDSDTLHTRLAAGDMPFAPAGKRLDLPRSSILVRSASRHDITEAGIGTIIESLGKTITSVEQAPAQRAHVRLLGIQQRPDYPETPLEGVEYAIPSGADQTLLQGGRRQLYFNPSSGLPVLVITTDHTGREVEYYCYDRVQYPVQLLDDEFDPEKLWPASQSH